MESRAKERLTGAVILVALVVLLVPALLTGPGDSSAPGQDAQNDGMREYTIDMNEQTRRAQPEVAAAPGPPSSPLAVPGEAAEPAPAPAPTPRPEPPSPVAAAPTNPMAASAPSQATSAPAPAPVSPPAPEPRTAPPPAATQPRGNFAVQLGTFGSRENADKLVRDMTAKGFAAFMVPTTSNGRELYRVRVGPARDRAAAEALAAQLKRVGQSGSIVPIS